MRFGLTFPMGFGKLFPRLQAEQRASPGHARTPGIDLVLTITALVIPWLTTTRGARTMCALIPVLSSFSSVISLPPLGPKCRGMRYRLWPGPSAHTGVNAR